MLEALRKGTGTWIAKIFIALLVLSFAVWGVADIFGGYGQRAVATVGDTEIPSEEYQFVYQNEVRVIGSRLGRTLTPEEARALGIDRQVLARLVANAALENEGSGMHLGVTDAAIVEMISRSPAFRDSSGRFNQAVFVQVLHANGLTEQGYVVRERKASVRRQLTQTMADTASLPKTLLSAIDRYQNEKRTLRYFIVPEAKLDAVPKPTPENLKSYYDSHKSAFTAPEFRKLAILALTPDTLKNTISISDADLRARYDAEPARYRTVERRHVLQISFPDQATAEKAHAKIQGGADFMSVAKEHDFTESDVDLGTLPKSGLADPAIADAAFKLDKGAVSSPVSGALATVLLKVQAIEPEVVQTFDEVKDTIRTTLAKERGAEEILDFHDKIEDERAAGATLVEIAGKLNLKHQEIDAVDSQGQGPDGKRIESIPEAASLINSAFRADVGVETDPIETRDDGLIWFDVTGVTPERTKDFEEVRDAVAEAWRAAEVRSQLAKKGQEIVDRARGGETLEALAESYEVTIKESEPVVRDQASGDVPRSAVAQAFALSEGSIGSSAAEDGKARIIFKVARIEHPAPLTADKAGELQAQLDPQLIDDYVAQYIGGLEADLGVSVNQQVYDVLTGREAPTPGTGGRGSF